MPLIQSSKLLAPILLSGDNFTHQMWGGDWIPRFKGMTGVRGPVGESWEFSARSEHPSKASLLDGTIVSLVELIQRFPKEILGPRWASLEWPTAPLLIKFIDAQDDLSLQVHPSDEDETAFGKNNGKSEAWIILECGSDDADGYVYLGFSSGKRSSYASKEEFEEAFFGALNHANAMGPSQNPQVRAKAERLVLSFLNKIKVRPGEVYDVPAGTIHAVGRGVRLYEVQQSSDVTYRVWDWNRPDTQALLEGKSEFRELHINQARGVLNFEVRGQENHLIQPSIISQTENTLEETLVVEGQKKFGTNQMTFNVLGAEKMLSTFNQFQVLTVVKGEIDLGFKVSQGQTILIPACLSEVKLKAVSPSAQLLLSYIPI